VLRAGRTIPRSEPAGGGDDVVGTPRREAMDAA
jgi:hypothetical protein